MADTDLSMDEEDLVDEPDDADLEEDAWDELDEDFDEDIDEELDEDVDEADEDEADEDEEDEEALDELEAEELEMLTDDEASETLIVDEAQELRAIRRAEISLDEGGGERAEGEFLCQSCFLVLKSSQLADKRRMYCRDCSG